MIYKIDERLPSLGITREYFDYPFSAVVSGASTYKAKPLYSILEYNELGNDYSFEDEIIVAGYPTPPIEGSPISLNIKPVFFSENSKSTYYLSSKLKGHDSFNCTVCFKIFLKESKRSYLGCFMTPQYYIEVLERIAMLTNSRQPFLLNRFYEKIVNEITLERVEYYFNTIPLYTEYLDKNFFRFMTPTERLLDSIK